MDEPQPLAPHADPWLTVAAVLADEEPVSALVLHLPQEEE